MPDTRPKPGAGSDGPRGESSGQGGLLPGNSAMRSCPAHLRLWAVTAVGLIVDLITKRWVVSTLGLPGEGAPKVLIEGYVRLVTVFNSGASFGIAQGRTGLLLTGAAVALVFMVWLFATFRREQWVSQVALGMLFAGALGNTHDRLFNGGNVVDFIDVNLHFWPANPWPAFNVADSLLCVGVGILLLSVLRGNRNWKGEAAG